jgi:hypothetical protein
MNKPARAPTTCNIYPRNNMPHRCPFARPETRINLPAGSTNGSPPESEMFAHKRA